ncbi:hypothetical protein GH714_038895 [Hevea brasiliensis]|uniref:Retrotransposon gag domain-containing protein n=1 Tax=Hevea brasiliensis TaxID=3981 RepID=A0A6A6KCD8_HEVBR|nr:hypothetical protein GH714_038895 [Hevea brasiliensis]
MVKGWMVGYCEQIISLVGNVAVKNRVKVAALHLEGKAIQWHQAFIKFHGLEAYQDWNAYVCALNARFGSHAYADPLSELRNLKQTGTLQDYFDEFDELYLKVDVTKEQALSFFLSRLVDELQMLVHPVLQAIIADKQIDPASHSKYTWHLNQMRRNGKLVVGSDVNLWNALIKEFHESSMGGHLGAIVIAKRLSVVVFWFGVWKDVQNYIRCVTC